MSVEQDELRRHQLAAQRDIASEFSRISSIVSDAIRALGDRPLTQQDRANIMTIVDQQLFGFYPRERGRFSRCQQIVETHAKAAQMSPPARTMRQVVSTLASEPDLLAAITLDVDRTHE